jgi:outer membrane receptor protein involved in Fe transport
MTGIKKPARTFALRAVLAASVSAAAMTSIAFAQDGVCDENNPNDPDCRARDEITVTGSRIGRGALDAPQPLQQFTGEDLILSGDPNIVDFLADVPALAGSVVPEDTTGAGLGDGGLSLLNLRDLGAARTLVLVNGRRHVGANPGTASVDVDTIPRLLIDSVDVVTGASSAVYGSDAVSGVVNFVLKDDFEGLTIDGAGASIAQGFEGFNYRGSLLAGKNFFDDRMNVYLSAEYEASDEVLQGDLDLDINDALLLEVDVDQLPPNNVDGFIDNVLVAGGVSSLSRPRGGILTLAHDIRQNGITDGLNIPFVNCASVVASNTAGNCFIIDPGFSYQFGAGGSVITPNFGSFRDPTGALRTIVQNGSGDPLSSFQSSQLPDTSAMRFQSGMKFDLSENLQFFAEGKYVKEDSVDGFQPAFFDVMFRQVTTAPGTTLPFALGSLTQFAVPIFGAPNQNPLMPASIATLINNNVRTTYASTAVNAAVTGTTPDRRAQMRVFTTDFGQRPQELTREMYRFVGGFRGDMDQFLFADNVNWEVGYTYGRVADENNETGTIDVLRLQYALDVVPNTVASLGAIGSPICRVKILAANAVPGFSATNPNISECVPAGLFGPGALSPAAPYVLTNLERTNRNAQHDIMGFMSGDLFDLWGAGPIQFSIGGEWRREVTSGTTSYLAGDPRILFANTGANFPERSYNVKEGFFEARIPVLQDLPLFQSLEVGGAVRVSDYNSIGMVTTWNVNGTWEMTDEITFRGTYGIATRAPNLTELFSPRRQTFVQITDPCSQPVILGTTNPITQANRIANCAALGIPATYVDPNPGTSNPGANAGNAFLLEEDSKSWTASLIYQPEWLDKFSLVVDFYNIRITNAIASAGIQTVVNLCVDGNTPNIPFCNTFTRDPGTFEIIDFTQGAVNFSALEARGIDFAAKYGIDLASGWFADDGMVPGSLAFSARGTYNMHRVNFANILDPTDGTELDGSLVGGQPYPKTRFLFTTAWNHGKLTLSHDLDFISSVDFEESFFFNTNADSGLQAYRTTGRFAQHDLTAVYDFSDNFTFRMGVVNLFDREPGVREGFNDYYDLFGRRYFIGARANF